MGGAVKRVTNQNGVFVSRGTNGLIRRPDYDIPF